MSPSSRFPWMRWIGVLAPSLILALIFAWIGGLFSPHRISSNHFMAIFHQSGSPGEGFRRAHAKGICVTGWFDANQSLAPYSSASLFSQHHVPVIGRFALAPPMPYVADGPTLTRSLALRFMPHDGAEWRTAMNDPPLQPMRDIKDAFAAFESTQPDPQTHRPDPQKAKEFAAQRPWLNKAFEAMKQQHHSADFADDRFNSLDSFRLINAHGDSHTVRWSVIPLNPPMVDPNTPHSQNPNYLFTHLIETLHQRPLQWSLVFTIANGHETTNDPSQPWDANDQLITAGTLTLSSASSEDHGPCNDTVFDPTILPSGMALSDDPIPALRSAVYMHSFAARSGEHKAPSSVSPAMTSPQ